LPGKFKKKQKKDFFYLSGRVKVEHVKKGVFFQKVGQGTAL
jgi:hypothetical protein